MRERFGRPPSAPLGKAAPRAPQGGKGGRGGAGNESLPRQVLGVGGSTGSRGGPRARSLRPARSLALSRAFGGGGALVSLFSLSEKWVVVLEVFSLSQTRRSRAGPPVSSEGRNGGGPFFGGEGGGCAGQGPGSFGEARALVFSLSPSRKGAARGRSDKDRWARLTTHDPSADPRLPPKARAAIHRGESGARGWGGEMARVLLAGGGGEGPWLCLVAPFAEGRGRAAPRHAPRPGQGVRKPTQ